MTDSHHIHLVSDATGETISAVARACLAQFESVEPTEHVWSLVRTPKHMERVIARIKENPGLVLYTLVNSELRAILEDHCHRLQLPSIAVLDPIIAALGDFLGAKSRGQPGRQHTMNAEYFGRIDAMHFAMLHDDGQGLAGLNDADVVLIGVSRTSKTPTCIYLANRGIKAGNIPLVANLPMPAELDRLTKPLIVGLTKDPERLVQVRKARLLSLNQHSQTDYVNLEQVRTELREARRLFTQRNWPVLDVTRRSIEEVAAAIINLLAEHRNRNGDTASPG
jgi:regulator of PEP synthase PpsR (kinase-PPPase family)